MAKNAIAPEQIRKEPLFHKKLNRTPVNTESIFAMTPETDHKVIGTFVNIETPGLSQPFTLKLYKHQEPFREVLSDNQRVTIPFSVARWINEEFCREEHSYIQDEKGQPLKTGKKIPRGKFLIEQH